MKMERSGNWVDLSLRKILKEIDTILSRFRSSEFFDLVVLNVDEFDETAISIPLLVDNEGDEISSYVENINSRTLLKRAKERRERNVD